MTEDVEKAEGNAEIVKAAVVVVAATIEMTNAQKRVQIQKTSVPCTVDISGASATRILEEMIVILQEKVAKMDKDVATPILAVVTMVEEVAEAVPTKTTTTTIMVTTMANGNKHHHLDGALHVWVASWMILRSGTAIRNEACDCSHC
jgi:hypothetical protein